MEIEDEGEAAAMAMEMEMQQIHMSSASTTPTGSSYNGHMTNPNSELMRGLNMESMAVGKRAAIAPCTSLVAATNVKYKECLKNHAASIGGHANDGCGEFMPSGEEGTLEALKCAACGCHRNFHRRDTTSSSSSCHHTSEMSSCYFCKRQPVLPLALPAPTPLRMIQHGQQNNHGNFTLGYAPHQHQHQHQQQYEVDHSGGYGSSGKKRFRTKFTQEQKDKMCAFAEKLGWRIQKHDDVAVQQFCGEVGVKRHVLKVWMHNNKHSLCKKQLTPPHHAQPQPHTPSSS